MKVKKLLKKIRKHKFQNGTTFYIEEHGEVDKETYVEYVYDREYDIHSLYLVEPQFINNSDMDCSGLYELPASMIINDDIRFYVRKRKKPRKKIK